MGKSGMYGEMPKLIIGKYEISLMSDKENEPNVWIEDSIVGEGSEFPIKQLESTIESFFNEFF